MNPSQTKSERWTVAGICIFLAAITLAVFGQTRGFDFVDFDDDSIIYENTAVTGGLTWKTIAGAFSYIHSDHWVPLTTLSHILDWQLYGAKAGGHHLTNVFIHMAAVIFLFLALRQLTGALWRAAFVAGIFAIHPQHVESVAWVAERKDGLSGMFFMLTLWAYGLRKNGLVFIFLVLGLTSKPMLVTVPCLLLLLDYWPLQRMAEGRKLIVQKIPLFALTLILGVIAVFAQNHYHAIKPLDHVSIPARIGNALISYTAYIGQMFYPAGLAAYYPLPKTAFPFWEIMAAFLLLAGISIGVFMARRKAPYLFVGWLWYLGMLLPVIGLIQVGDQLRADRYTYLPQIGLYIMVTWGVAELCAGWRQRPVALGGAAAMVIGALFICARGQTSYWKNSETLWTHALSCTPDNVTVQNDLGNALMERGAVEQAATHFQRALEIEPDFADAHNNLGVLLLQKGEVDEAVAQFQKTLKILPNCARAYYNIGTALLQKGEVDNAMTQFQKTLEIEPDYAEANYNLGAIFAQKGQVDESIARLQKALEIKPDYADAHYALGIAYMQKKQPDEAMAHCQKGMEMDPGRAAALVMIQNNLGQIAWAFATSPDASIRNGTKALAFALQADRICGGMNPIIIEALAAAYAETGQFSEAIAAVQRALPLAVNQNNPGLMIALQEQLKLYQQGSPFREAGSSHVN